MSVNITIERHQTYIFVIVSGSHDPNDVRKIMPQVFAAAKDAGVCKILFDARQLIGNPDLADRIEFGQYCLGLARNLEAITGNPPRVAIVGSASLIDPEPRDQQGVPFLTADDMLTALLWLGIDRRAA